MKSNNWTFSLVLELCSRAFERLTMFPEDSAARRALWSEGIPTLQHNKNHRKTTHISAIYEVESDSEYTGEAHSEEIEEQEQTLDF